MSANELKVRFASPAEVLAGAIVLPLLGIISVSLRLMIRASRTGFSWDDWTIAGALIFVIGMGVAQIYGEPIHIASQLAGMYAAGGICHADLLTVLSLKGVSKHTLAYPTPEPADLTPMIELTQLPSQQRTTEVIYFITWILMIPANGLIKLSALFFYRRVFVIHSGSAFDIANKIMIAICALWTIAFEFATIFGCGRHFDYAWGPLIEIGSCNTNVRLNGLMISDLITDLLVWLMPMPVRVLYPATLLIYDQIWSLQMSIQRKVSASAVLLLAAFSLAAAVVRLIVELEIADGGYAAHTDIDKTLTTLLFWSMLESGLALIAACLPTFNNFIQSRLRSLASSIRSALSVTKSRIRSDRYKSSDLSDSDNVSGFQQSRDTNAGGSIGPITVTHEIKYQNVPLQG